MRWQLKNRPEMGVMVWPLEFFDQENGLAVDVHLDLSLFGLRRSRCNREGIKVCAARVDGLWLPDAETDWLMALVESLHGLRQRSLRRHWEREGLGERLMKNAERSYKFRLQPVAEILYQLGTAIVS